jgi:nitrogen fixation-related uncharacterized protein
MSEQEKPKKRAGRKTEYDPLIAAEICTRISCGESLRQICMEDRMPVHSTIYLWLLQNKQFSDNYTRAREEQADTLADDIQAIADELPAEIVDDKGISRVDGGWVTWQKNRMDARKWVAAKLKPKKYGERQVLAGDAENPLEVKVESTIFDTLLHNLELTKQAKSK